MQAALGPLAQDRCQRLEQVLHHAPPVCPDPGQIHTVQDRIKVVLRAEDLPQQPLDPPVIVLQQRKAGGGALLLVPAKLPQRGCQLGIILLQCFARRKKRW